MPRTRRSEPPREAVVERLLCFLRSPRGPSPKAIQSKAGSGLGLSEVRPGRPGEAFPERHFGPRPAAGGISRILRYLTAARQDGGGRWDSIPQPKDLNLPLRANQKIHLQADSQCYPHVMEHARAETFKQESSGCSPGHLCWSLQRWTGGAGPPAHAKRRNTPGPKSRWHLSVKQSEKAWQTGVSTESRAFRRKWHARKRC